MDYEQLQNSAEFVTGSDSDFSEEDLASNWIGFYMAYRIEQEGNYSTALNEIIELCGLKTKEQSQSIFEEEYQNGAGFIQDWRSWYPRLLRLNTERCDDSECLPLMRRWPTEFSTLYHNVQRFNAPGMWGWYGNLSLSISGVPVKTDVPGVYAMKRAEF